MTEGRMVRGVSLLHAITIILGYVIGASIFLLVGPLAGSAGPCLFLSYIIAAIPVIFVCLYNVQLGAALPVTAANYVVSTKMISPFCGFFVNWAMVVAVFFGVPLLAWGFADYLSFFIPGLPLQPVALGVLALIALVNYLGVKPAVWLQTLMVAIFAAALLIFALGGITHVDPENFNPLFPMGFGAVLITAVSAYFSYIGFTVLTEIAGEIKNPRKNIPIALVVSFIAVLTIYFLVTYVLTGTLHWETAGASKAAITKAAEGFLPSGLVTFIGIAALFASATTINSVILTSSRDIMMLGRDCVFPEIFGRINKKFSTPDVAIGFIFLISAVGVFLAYAIEKYAILAVLGLLVIHLFAATAVFRLPKIRPDLFKRARVQFSPFWRWFTWIGSLVVALFFMIMGMADDVMGAIFFISLMVLGVVYWHLRKRYLLKKGVDLEESMKKYTDMLKEELEVE